MMSQFQDAVITMLYKPTVISLVRLNVINNKYVLQARQTLEMEFNNLLQVATERRPDNEHLNKS